MISATNSKKICIHITTYKREVLNQGRERKMNEKGNKKCHKSHGKYVCALCLNPQKEDKINDCCKKIPKGCPICNKSREPCGNINLQKKEKERPPADKEDVDKTKRPVPNRDPNVKTVQTSETTVAQGLSLLNEVLTVFQNKKVDINKDKVKSGLLKDVAVSTEDKNNEHNKHPSRLTVSTFQYSIDNNSKKPENGKFTIVNCSQPEFVKKQHSVDLIKHKSSSIPQMKLEELKYSLKEKSRSKDAIEEVNRMFATVRRPGKHMENANRPMVRSGPRVLPVVKNNTYYQDTKKDFGVECNNLQCCKCCQTCMSSGDSFSKPSECCHDTEKETCDKCVYMLCCHYENKCKRQTGVLICEHCRNLNEEHYCHDSYVDDSC